MLSLDRAQLVEQRVVGVVSDLGVVENVVAIAVVIELALVDEDPHHPAGGRRLYRIYGDASFERDETGTDLAAVAAGRIAVTPIHFDLTDREGLDALQRYDLARLIEPAAQEVTEP